MNKAIRELRKESPNSIYIASPEAMDFLNEAYRTSNWRLIGRTFGSTGVENSRPHGTYLIPRFSGRAANGHWTLIVIQKRETGCIGFHIDSLGSADITESVFHELKSIFNCRRAFSWHQTQSLPQTELECGFRTIQAIQSICEGIRQNKDIFQCVAIATLINTPAESYNSIDCRKNVTDIIMGTTEWRAVNRPQMVAPGTKKGNNTQIDKDTTKTRKRKKRNRKRSAQGRKRHKKK